MKNRRFYSVIAILAGLACSATAAQPGSGLLYGAVVFVVSPSGSNMGAFLASELAKQKVPVTVSSEKPSANYILAGFVEPDSEQFSRSSVIWKGIAVLADARTHAIAWNAEFKGPCPPCDAAPERGEQFMAARFVKRLKHDLFLRKSLSEHIDDFLAP
jgi:hypothetical protein